MLRRYIFVFAVILAAPGAQAANISLEPQFSQTVRPFVTKYCIACHSGETPAAQFYLKSYSTLDSVVRDNPRWALVADRLEPQFSQTVRPFVTKYCIACHSGETPAAQ